jgi:hypothetical protein
MIAKIISNSNDSSGFPSIKYSLKKEDLSRGELLEIRNFPTSYNKSCKDYELRNYLELTTKGLRHNSKKQIKNPEFHAVISGKGNVNKEELNNVSVKWLEKMGYSKQPSIIVFHNDSNNNHVHIITSRVDIETGKKINNDNERYKSLDALESILGKEIRRDKKKKNILSYDFETKGQLISTLDQYKIPYNEDEKGNISVKYSKDQFDFNKEYFQTNSKKKIDFARKKQLRAIFYKYKEQSNLKAFKIQESRRATYDSQFISGINKKFGLELVFHSKDDKDPFGYSIIDHKENKVYKGSDIMKMKEIVNFSSNKITRKEFEKLKDMKAQSKLSAEIYLKKNNQEFAKDFLDIDYNLKRKKYISEWKKFENSDEFLKKYNLEYHKGNDNSILINEYSKQIHEINKDEKDFEYFLETGHQIKPQITFQDQNLSNINVEKLMKDFSYSLDNQTSNGDVKKKKKQKRKRKL